MTDRKKGRKGARKTAASNSKAAAAPVAAAGRPVGLPVGGEIKEPVPFEGVSGTGPIVPLPSDQPPPRNLRANEPIQRAWEEPPVTPPQTGILGAAATAAAGSLAQPLIQEVLRIGAVGSLEQPPPFLPEISGPTIGHAATEIMTVFSDQPVGVETTVIRATPPEDVGIVPPPPPPQGVGPHFEIGDAGAITLAPPEALDRQGNNVRRLVSVSRWPATELAAWRLGCSGLM
jgi:hypothetical protein